MSENSVIVENDGSFFSKWSKIRLKGRMRYIISRGIVIGLILFTLYVIIEIIEINLSEFEKYIYQEYGMGYFIRRTVVYLPFYLTLGFSFSIGSWRKKEGQYQYLTKHYD